VPESGDGIQVLKAGVIEVADLFVVNKADRPGADRMRSELEVMLGLRSGRTMKHVPAHHGALKAGRASSPDNDGSGTEARPTQWIPPVLATVAVKGEGTAELVEALDRHHDWMAGSATLEERRRRRLYQRTREVVERAARQWIWSETAADQIINARLDGVVAGEASPYEIAALVLESLKQGARV
jgi:LAO/AO transport system kinase